MQPYGDHGSLKPAPASPCATDTALSSERPPPRPARQCHRRSCKAPDMQCNKQSASPVATNLCPLSSPRRSSGRRRHTSFAYRKAEHWATGKGQMALTQAAPAGAPEVMHSWPPQALSREYLTIRSHFILPFCRARQAFAALFLLTAAFHDHIPQCWTLLRHSMQVLGASNFPQRLLK